MFCEIFAPKPIQIVHSLLHQYFVVYSEQSATSIQSVTRGKKVQQNYTKVKQFAKIFFCRFYFLKNILFSISHFANSKIKRKKMYVQFPTLIS